MSEAMFVKHLGNMSHCCQCNSLTSVSLIYFEHVWEWPLPMLALGLWKGKKTSTLMTHCLKMCFPTSVLHLLQWKRRKPVPPVSKHVCLHSPTWSSGHPHRWDSEKQPIQNPTAFQRLRLDSNPGLSDSETAILLCRWGGFQDTRVVLRDV